MVSQLRDPFRRRRAARRSSASCSGVWSACPGSPSRLLVAACRQRRQPVELPLLLAALLVEHCAHRRTHTLTAIGHRAGLRSSTSSASRASTRARRRGAHVCSSVAHDASFSSSSMRASLASATFQRRCTAYSPQKCLGHRPAPRRPPASYVRRSQRRPPRASRSSCARCGPSARGAGASAARAGRSLSVRPPARATSGRRGLSRKTSSCLRSAQIRGSTRAASSNIFDRRHALSSSQASDPGGVRCGCARRRRSPPPRCLGAAGGPTTTSRTLAVRAAEMRCEFRAR